MTVGEAPALDAVPLERLELARKRMSADQRPETVRRLCCDSSVTAIIRRQDGEPLTVTKRTRTIPRWVRRAVHARDGDCRFPGVWREGVHRRPPRAPLVEGRSHDPEQRGRALISSTIEPPRAVHATITERNAECDESSTRCDRLARVRAQFVGRVPEAMLELGQVALHRARIATRSPTRRWPSGPGGGHPPPAAPGSPSRGGGCARRTGRPARWPGPTAPHAPRADGGGRPR